MKNIQNSIEKVWLRWKLMLKTPQSTLLTLSSSMPHHTPAANFVLPTKRIVPISLRPLMPAKQESGKNVLKKRWKSNVK